MNLLRHLLTAIMVTGLGITGAVSATAAESQERMRPDSKQHLELVVTKIAVSDLVKSYQFYTDIIGLKLVSSSEMPLSKAPTSNDSEKEHVEIPLNFSGSTADPMFLLIKDRRITPTAASAKMAVVGFRVANRGAAIERAIQKGYKPIRDFTAIDGRTHVTFVLDPDGYTVEIF